MSSVREIRGREFAKGIAEIKRAQRQLERGRRGRQGQALRNYFTTDDSNSRSKMRPIADLRQMPTDKGEMLYALWEIVRTM